jgi:hypothetical protein
MGRRPVSAGRHYAAVREPLELVRNGLHPQADLFGEVSDGHLALAVHPMQQPQPGVVAQHLEQPDYIGRLLWGHKWPFRKRRLARVSGRPNGGAPRRVRHHSIITLYRVTMEDLVAV